MNAVDPGADPAALLAAIVESSDDAIVGKALDGRILSWNAAAERIFGWSAEEIIGRNVRTLIPEDRQAEEDAIIASISGGERMPSFETVRQRKDGSLVSVAVTVSPVRDAEGRVVAASQIARDMSESISIQNRLALSEERFRLLADNISQLAWIADSEGSIFWYNKRWFDYTGTTLEQMEGWGWKEVHHPDHVDRVVEKIASHFASGEDWEDTFPLRSAEGEWRWFLSRAKPIRDDSGTLLCWFGTNTDVTAMREAEERIELLLQEVNHRSKNMLAVVQSLARRSNIDRPDFIERLEQRIHGLAANQDVLVRRAWSRIPVQEMVEAQLRSLGDAQAQIRCEGPLVELSSGAAEAMAMAFHEMGTNALKYGALSVPEGRVAIRWRISGAGDEARFHIEWVESGGPPVREPERQGFGTRIIADVPRVKLNAEVRTCYDPEGFRWILDCAAASIL
ncbi:PAS domain S-box protein [Novosphingobium beihaiensis]|uniref:histidine kinase n=1 Tax=Novosphingobium beihaiensis TaxID=2930389 RepID=A0ABT0BTY8_9SPHN|nr:PAS domain S-box protein [Novosphingobium beihaiensis]MCJ2188526.1 PAS domain S-box protein [Novosphingobium beihaiensis]